MLLRKNFHSSNTPHTERLISQQREKQFKRSYWKVLLANSVNIGLSGANVATINFNALSGSQFAMETADFTMAAASYRTHQFDSVGQHERASRFRQKLYALHAGAAALGLYFGISQWDNTASIDTKSVAVSVVVGALNADAVRTVSKAQKHALSEKESMVFTSEKDRSQQRIDNIHRYNDTLVKNIAITNVAEAAGGIFGGLGYYALDKSPAIGAIASSTIVAGFMVSQWFNERHFRQSLDTNGTS